MSRIGRQPIPIPAGVEVSLEGPVITVTGPKGTLTRSLPAAMTVETVDGTLVVTRPSEAKQHKQLHGLTRTLVANMVDGVTTGFRVARTLAATCPTSSLSMPTTASLTGVSTSNAIPAGGAISTGWL